MADQLIFDLPVRVAMGRADFLISDANAAAVSGIDAWAAWPHGKAVLIGPEASGKTHLAHVWAAQTGAQVIAASDLMEADLDTFFENPAMVVEDVDQIAEQKTRETSLFHLHNALQARSAPLLLTARKPVAGWGLALPDLASRVAQAQLLTLDAPDDALLAALMVKLAQDRQLKMTPALVQYALPRMQRSFAGVQALIRDLDALSLAAKEPPMQKHLRRLLGEA